MRQLSEYEKAVLHNEETKCKTCVYFKNYLFNVTDQSIIGSQVQKPKMKIVVNTDPVGVCICLPKTSMGWPIIFDCNLEHCGKWIHKPNLEKDKTC